MNFQRIHVRQVYLTDIRKSVGVTYFIFDIENSVNRCTRKTKGCWIYSVARSVILLQRLSLSRR